MSEDLVVPSPLAMSDLFNRFDFKNASVNIAANMFGTWERTKDKKEIIPLTKLQGLTIQSFWNELWSDNTNLLLEYHTARKEKDMQCSKWEMHPDKSTGYRVLTLQTVVEVPRSGTYTPLHEAHRFAFSMDGGKPKLVYQISSQTPNVPAGTTFRCETLMEVTADSLESECSVTMFANTKKMSIGFTAIQFIATPRAVRELQAAYVVLFGIVTAKLCGEPLQLRPTLTLGTPDAQDATPAAPAVAAAAPPQEVRSGGNLPLSALYAMIAVAILVTLLMIWTVSSVSSANRNLEEIVRSAKVQLPSGSEGAAGSSLWDLVDRELGGNLVDELLSKPSDENVSLDSASTLTKPQLSILAKQEALFGRAMSALVEVQERQDGLERQQSWLLSICLSQLLILVIMVVKVFFLSS